MSKSTAVRAARVCAAAALGAALSAAPAAHAKLGDTHITGQGIVQTIDCNDATLFVNGNNINVTALGNCYAVTVQGAGNVIVADTVTNDITVYGFDQTVFYKWGDPVVWDRGRELGLLNRVERVMA
ncbi:DUF3060 domain-containing protein [Mycobacterium sp. MYCO198283]|uniref:DUF3060 domain-containing protein n=1 Tax=Mycobacterium sp. MYCO198283 TaxID=2883505 RepID=UPI001E60943C|nr:DUF3060 domain-containing protein [Mycobacterium sp. MYCO198283]MCG5431897.1 DUF3060 domain-containing protein [Mycobacterium sp. MYCO198283]